MPGKHVLTLQAPFTTMCSSRPHQLFLYADNIAKAERLTVLCCRTICSKWFTLNPYFLCNTGQHLLVEGSPSISKVSTPHARHCSHGPLHRSRDQIPHAPNGQDPFAFWPFVPCLFLPLRDISGTLRLDWFGLFRDVAGSSCLGLNVVRLLFTPVKYSRPTSHTFRVLEGNRRLTRSISTKVSVVSDTTQNMHMKTHRYCFSLVFDVSCFHFHAMLKVRIQIGARSRNLDKLSTVHNFVCRMLRHLVPCADSLICLSTVTVTSLACLILQF